MTRTVTSQQPLVDVHSRITKSLYDQLLVECGHCSCTMTAVIRNAIATEVNRRRMARKQAADRDILAGQIDIEGRTHAG